MGRAVRTLLVLLFLAAFAAAAWVTVRGAQARGHLEEAADRVGRLQLQVTRGETDAAEETVRAVRRDVARARDLTGDPVWTTFARFPWGGQNLRAVTEATRAVDTLADDGLPALVRAGEGLRTLREEQEQGRQSPASVQLVVDEVRVVETSTDRARRIVEAVDRDHLVPAVDDALDDLLESLGTAREVGAGLAVDAGVQEGAAGG
ncbi:hypothetical protein [Thalassiella azotivora]